MTVVKQTNVYLIICIENKLLIYNKSTKKDQIVDIPKVILPSNLTTGQKEVLESETRSVTTACASTTGAYFAIATQNKQVVVYKSDFTPTKNFTLNRAASKLRFTSNNDVLIADKTGDAYLYKLDTDDLVPILGHLSMLLDVLATDCTKYIITCDRDEKIRVSHFPNAYNIASYCLGHRKFVSNIELIDDLLISASGDGTIRFWNYLTGAELHKIDTNDHIENKSLIERFCEEMDREKCEVTSLPITDMQVYKTNVVYIAVSVLNSKSLHVYVVDKDQNEIECKLSQKLSFDSVPSGFSLSEDLVVLIEGGVRMFRLNGGEFVTVEDEALDAFYDRNVRLLAKLSAGDVSLLFKKKFDNVQDYLERKKLRIEGK